MAEPKISVVIPTFNRAHFLREAIDSILAQTVPVFEVIVVDDGSTDDTQNVVKSYREPIRYLWQKNQGPSTARNYGIREAKGDWIAFLDSDDLWVPQKNQVQIEFLQRNPEIDFVFGNLSNFTESHSSEEPEVLNDSVQQYLVANATDLKGLFRQLLICNPIPTPTVVFRRDLVNRVGFFDESMRHCEDYDLWLRLATCCRAGFIDQVLVKRRMHDTNEIKAQESVYAGTLKVLGIWSKKGDLPADLRQTLLQRIAALQYDLSSHLIKHGKFKAAQAQLAELKVRNLNPSPVLRLKIWLKTTFVALMAKTG